VYFPGHIEERYTGNRDFLLQVDLPVRNQEECYTIYEPDNLDVGMLCAGFREGMKGVCYVSRTVRTLILKLENSYFTIISMKPIV